MQKRNTCGLTMEKVFDNPGKIMDVKILNVFRGNWCFEKLIVDTSYFDSNFNHLDSLSKHEKQITERCLFSVSGCILIVNFLALSC